MSKKSKREVDWAYLLEENLTAVAVVVAGMVIGAFLVYQSLVIKSVNPQAAESQGEITVSLQIATEEGNKEVKMPIEKAIQLVIQSINNQNMLLTEQHETLRERHKTEFEDLYAQLKKLKQKQNSE